MTPESCNYFRFVIVCDDKVTICQFIYQTNRIKLFIQMKKNVAIIAYRHIYIDVYASIMHKTSILHSILHRRIEERTSSLYFRMKNSYHIPK